MTKTEDHRKVEAVLFAVGRDFAIEDIAGLCNLTHDQTITILNDLRSEYNGNQENSLTLHEKGKFWKFSVKDTYLPLVTSLVENTELDKSTMETLAVIAWRYPILQADVIKIRNNKAYEHMKLLEERGFIAKNRSGRTYKIKLTDKFFEYFDLPSKDAKEAFRKVIPKEIQEEVTRSEKEINEKEEEIERQKLEEPQKIEPEKSIEEVAQEAADLMDKEEIKVSGDEDDNEEEGDFIDTDNQEEEKENILPNQPIPDQPLEDPNIQKE
jgi:segregation and condensation protein B